MSDSQKDPSESACPVDPAARSRWSSIFSFGGGAPHPVPSKDAEDACPVDATARSKWLSEQALAGAAPADPAKSCDSSTLDAAPAAPAPAPTGKSKLDSVREVSSIPRASLGGSNAENFAGQEGATKDNLGNWIYPSQEMFFAAMKRKSHDPKAADMRTIVPIHNAVNERAWAEIKQWEAGRGSEKCVAPPGARGAC